MSKYTIWIEAEYFEEGTWDKHNDCVNVAVEFDDGSRWAAIFETFKNIQTSIEKLQQTGECLGGKYRFITNRILVDEISRERIAEVIKDLIDHDMFKYGFDPCDDSEDEHEDEPNDPAYEEWLTSFNAYKKIVYYTYKLS